MLFSTGKKSNDSSFIKVNKKELFHLKNDFFSNSVFVCLCGYVHMSASVLGGQTHQLLELALQTLMSYLMWVLEIELRHFAREVHVLNC